MYDKRSIRKNAGNPKAIKLIIPPKIPLVIRPTKPATCMAVAPGIVCTIARLS